MNTEDLRIDVYTNGQWNCVRITHKPTGTVAECDDFTSQLKNKAKALERLREQIGEVPPADDLVPITIYMRRSELIKLIETREQ